MAIPKWRGLHFLLLSFRFQYLKGLPNSRTLFYITAKLPFFFLFGSIQLDTIYFYLGNARTKLHSPVADLLEPVQCGRGPTATVAYRVPYGFSILCYLDLDTIQKKYQWCQMDQPYSVPFMKITPCTDSTQAPDTARGYTWSAARLLSQQPAGVSPASPVSLVVIRVLD